MATPCTFIGFYRMDVSGLSEAQAVLNTAVPTCPSLHGAVVDAWKGVGELW